MWQKCSEKACYIVENTVKCKLIQRAEWLRDSIQMSVKYTTQNQGGGRASPSGKLDFIHFWLLPKLQFLN